MNGFYSELLCASGITAVILLLLVSFFNVCVYSICLIFFVEKYIYM